MPMGLTSNAVTPLHAVRTTVAAVLCYLIARLVRLPEPYWAPISTLIVMQSTLGASLPISMQRLAGTAIGCAAGALADARFPGSVWAFGAAILLVGLLSAATKLDRISYRYAGITIAIVMLVTRAAEGWLIALHRFLEVSLGIGVGLLVTAVWPEKLPDHAERVP